MTTLTTLKTSVEGPLAVLRLDRAHGNAINDAMVEDLMAAFHDVEADDQVRGVLLGAGGKLFCPGLDLVDLFELDRETMTRFMERFSACLTALYTFPKPLVMAMHGHAMAGGCVISLTGDRRILKEGAQVGLNEVKVGVPLPFGVSQLLRETIHKSALADVALLGRNYSGDEAVEVGLVDEVYSGDDFEPYCLSVLAGFADKDLAAYAATKRYLRSATVERIRAHDRAFIQEFLDCWFNDATRDRIRGIVEGLKTK